MEDAGIMIIMVISCGVLFIGGVATGVLMQASDNARNRTLSQWIDGSLEYYTHTLDRLKGRPMRRKINIEIQANLSDTEYDALKNALKYSVRTILATTTMIGAERPSVAMFGSDFFTKNEEIDVYVDADEE